MLSRWTIFSAALGVALSATTAFAGLGVQSGVYKSDQSSRLKLFIKEEKSTYASIQYAMLTAADGRHTGLFKIDPVDGAIFQLTRLYVSDQSILTSLPLSRASFAAQLMTDAKGDTNLMLTATSAGVQSGCPSSLRFKLDADEKQAWTSLMTMNASRLRINRDAQIDMVMQNRGPLREYAVTLTGADDLRASWSGNYLVTEQISGIGLMRKRQLDSLNASGFSLSRNVETVLVPMRSDSGRPSVRFVRMAGGDSQCMSPSSTIK